MPEHLTLLPHFDQALSAALSDIVQKVASGELAELPPIQYVYDTKLEASELERLFYNIPIYKIPGETTDSDQFKWGLEEEDFSVRGVMALFCRFEGTELTERHVRLIYDKMIKNGIPVSQMKQRLVFIARMGLFYFSNYKKFGGSGPASEMASIYLQGLYHAATESVKISDLDSGLMALKARQRRLVAPLDDEIANDYSLWEALESLRWELADITQSGHQGGYLIEGLNEELATYYLFFSIYKGLNDILRGSINDGKPEWINHKIINKPSKSSARR